MYAASDIGSVSNSGGNQMIRSFDKEPARSDTSVVVDFDPFAASYLFAFSLRELIFVFVSFLFD